MANGQDRGQNVLEEDVNLGDESLFYRDEEGRYIMKIGGSPRRDLFVREEELRQEAINAARQAAAESRRGIADVELATEAGQLGIRQSAAQAAAQAAGSAGTNLSSGARAAQFRQAALSGGVQQAQFGAQQAVAATEARQAAALADLEAARFEREAGNIQKDRQEKINQLRTQIAEIYDRHDGFWDFDEGAAKRDIMSLAVGETDPVIRDFIANEALRAEASD